MSDLMLDFAELRGVELPAEEETPKKKKRVTKRKTFKHKTDNKKIDDYTCPDLVRYFVMVAERNGRKYLPSFAKDSAIMKRLQSTYTNQEICDMIDFLFESPQTYLDKNRLTIGLIGSGWVNSIHPDSESWVNGTYRPKGKKSVREWGGSVEEGAVIGQW